MMVDDRLEPINTVITRYEDIISNEEWEGNFAEADRLRVVLNRLYKQREEGELYLPKF